MPVTGSVSDTQQNAQVIIDISLNTKARQPIAYTISVQDGDSCGVNQLADELMQTILEQILEQLPEVQQ
ncbi:hypothetical protein [Vibrio quintilis]|uniref:Uncharacterized protein n=1 Tax=Vibrio quintilis TaxID=1117707 RepID=A0A1M7Z1W9_9VIBR|nr:hypothetical protein [Vibrio quintilis]SHO58770.1 hypothetical protein VQ7734_04542 [Vibrio quintilis]